MVDGNNGANWTRRNALKLAAGSLGVAALGGGVSAHPDTGVHPNDDSHDDHRFHGTSPDTSQLGYHSLGGVGSESLAGQPSDPHDGPLSEVWVEGDLAFVSMLSSDDDTQDRGVAVVDVSGYTRATSESEAENAEMAVTSFIGNQQEAASCQDVKATDDGRFVFVAKQAIGALYGDASFRASTDPDSLGVNVQGVEAYDVSDPGNPEYVGTASGPNAGFHNLIVHEVGGTDYVFAVQGAVPGDAGVHVYEFDRTTGALTLVNFFTSDGDASQGEGGTDAAEYYSHDVYVHDDPRTGRPLAYFSQWNNGVRIFDVSDPTDTVELGYFPMRNGHYGQPAPTLVDGHRTLVAGQEFGDRAASDPHSGKYYLVNADPLDAVVEGEQTGPVELSADDEFTLFGGDSGNEMVAYDGYMYSPHNCDVSRDGWVTAAWYHGGVRFLNVVDDGTGGLVFEQKDPSANYFAEHEDVPESSKGTDSAAPNFWSAATANGVTFGSCINTGLYAIRHGGVGGSEGVGFDPTIDVDVSRHDDGTVYTGGQTNQIDLAVDADEQVRVYDRIPTNWSVVTDDSDFVGDVERVVDVGDGKVVELAPTRTGTVTYFVEVPSSAEESGSATVGPVKYNTESDAGLGETWEAVAGTRASYVVSGQGT